MGKNVVVIGAQWGDEGKGQNRRLADGTGFRGGALQRRP